MKFAANSSIVALIFAASAAAAPRHVARSDSADDNVSNLPTLKETVDQVFNNDQQMHQRRDDDIEGSSDQLPTVMEAVDQVFAAEEKEDASVSRRWDPKLLEDEVEGVFDANDKVEGKSNQVYDHNTEFSCHSGGTSKKVSPRWLKEQTYNKAAYMTQNSNDLPEVPKSKWFGGDDAGMDWTGNQDGDMNTNTHDWASMTLAWSKYGTGGTTPEVAYGLARDIITVGIDKCTKPESEGDRTRGFAARYNGEWVFYLFAGEQNNKKAENRAGESRKWLKWQTPTQLMDPQWDDFLRTKQKTPNPWVKPEGV